MITIMDNTTNPKLKDFTKHLSKSLAFRNLYVGDGTYFFRGEARSKKKVGEELAFTLEVLTTSIGNTRTAIFGRTHHIKVTM